MSHKKFLTIGSAVADTMFYVNDAQLIKSSDDEMIAFPYDEKYLLEQVYVTYGGGACNTAVNLAQLGADVSVLTGVGHDAHATGVMHALEEHGVHTHGVKAYQGLTAFSMIPTVIDAQRKEHVVFHHPGAGSLLEVSLQDMLDIAPDNIHICSLSSQHHLEIIQTVFAYKKKMAQAGREIVISWNPGNKQLDLPKDMLYDLLAEIDILLVNKREASSLSSTNSMDVHELMQELHALGPAVVVITDSVYGAHVCDDSGCYSTEIYECLQAVDTTGVGDAFGSTFIYAYYHYKDTLKSLQFASINAGHVASKVGAQVGGKNLAHIEKDWEEYYNKK
jgi:sugar/nucleoside kinase (ribokinase family)